MLEAKSTRQPTDLWKATPTSANRTSRFFPLKHTLAPSPTFSNSSQHATHGSVFTRANERSSFRGTKSFFFCLDSWAESQAMIADQGQVISLRKQRRENENLQSIILCKKVFAAPSIRLTVWLLNTTMSLLTVTDALANGKIASVTYCCQRWQMRSTERRTCKGWREG